MQPETASLSASHLHNVCFETSCLEEKSYKRNVLFNLSCPVTFLHVHCCFDKLQNFREDLNPQLSRSPRRDLFLFPDDELASPVEEYFPPEDTGVELANPGESDEEEEDSDEDFCILEHPDKEPEGLSHEVIIKCLADEQINIVENHFTVLVRI